MIKLLIILLLGIIDTALWTWWAINTHKLKSITSSNAMGLHVLVWLSAVKLAISGNTWTGIIIYAIGSWIGNFLKIKHEQHLLINKRPNIIKGI